MQDTHWGVGSYTSEEMESVYSIALTNWIRNEMSPESFKNVLYKLYVNKSYIYKKELALNNQQWLLCHKTQSNQSRIYVIKP